jgi:hypothetical protein
MKLLLVRRNFEKGDVENKSSLPLVIYRTIKFREMC